MYCPNKHCLGVRASGEPSEYHDEFGACPTCGSPLVVARPSWATEEEDDEGDILFVECVTIGTVTDRSAVPVIHSLLSTAGVSFLLRNEKTQRAAVRIVVERSRAEEACELLSGPEIEWVRN
jgi:hypothetical protein